MSVTQRSNHGTMGASNATTMLDTTNINTVEVQLTGTWVGTVSFEASLDAGTTWFSVAGTPVDADTAAVRSVTGNGVWSIDSTGHEMVRTRMSAYTSGTATARLEGSGGRR